jgi:hypothetical protein
MSGIKAVVLTRDLRSYQVSDESFKPTEEQATLIHRSFSLDAKHDLSVFGKYLEIQTIPDEWWVWRLLAVRLGKKLIDQYQPDVIWSTYPVISAHLLAMQLAKWSHLPWIADYQDPMKYHLQTLDTIKARYNRSTDARIISQCDMAVFATKQAAALYGEIYPRSKSKLRSISNGYDGDLYDDISTQMHNCGEKYVLYSGILYIGDSIRDPTPLFDAIQICKDRHKLSISELKMRFRGAGDGAGYKTTLTDRKIDLYVEFAKRISFRDSLIEINAASVLILIQRAGAETQIPGKAYEYLKSGRPVVVIAPGGSATADLMGEYTDSGVIVSENAIEIASFINDALNGRMPDYFDRDISAYSRNLQSQKYVELIKEYVG